MIIGICFVVLAGIMIIGRVHFTLRKRQISSEMEEAMKDLHAIMGENNMQDIAKGSKWRNKSERKVSSK